MEDRKVILVHEPMRDLGRELRILRAAARDLRLEGGCVRTDRPPRDLSPEPTPFVNPYVSRRNTTREEKRHERQRLRREAKQRKAS